MFTFLLFATRIVEKKIHIQFFLLILCVMLKLCLFSFGLAAYRTIFIFIQLKRVRLLNGAVGKNEIIVPNVVNLTLERILFILYILYENIKDSECAEDILDSGMGWSLKNKKTTIEKRKLPKIKCEPEYFGVWFVKSKVIKNWTDQCELLWRERKKKHER